MEHSWGAACHNYPDRAADLETENVRADGGHRVHDLLEAVLAGPGVAVVHVVGADPHLLRHPITAGDLITTHCCLQQLINTR